MKKIWRILLIVLLIIVIPGTFIFLAVRGMKKKDIYKVETMKFGHIEKKTIATGKVLPRKEIEIKPQSISGIIEKLYVEEGNLVKKGDKIAQISVIPDEASLNAAKNRVRMAQISYNKALTDFNRNKGLFEKNIISKVEFEKNEVNLNNTKEELNAARSNLQIIRTGASSRSKKANTMIKSTINGMILEIPVKEGNSVIASNNFNSGTTIALVADMGEMVFEGNVDETEVAKIKEGMEIDIVIGAYRDKSFKAKIEHVSPKGKEDQGAVKFDIKAKMLLEKGQFIRAGFSANANIVVERKDSIYYIKESYIEFEEDSTYVEVLTKDKPQEFDKKFIKTGISDGVIIEVLNGLTLDDKIKTGEIVEKKDSKKEKKDE